ncbi:MAG: type II toxin-antitoxin system VapC family toxin [Parvularculaceae bacterium]
MIVDTSALVAILTREPEADMFADAIARADAPSLSAATYVETAVVIDARRNPALSRAFDRFLEENRLSVESVTPAQAKIAREAYRDFGRGSGNPAQLNFGDCFVYALARDKNLPLLFKGNDFRHTDLDAAVSAEKDVYE